MAGESIEDRLEGVVQQIREHLQGGADEAVQKELGLLINLLPDLPRAYGAPLLVAAAEAAVAALLVGEPNLQLATQIRTDLEKRVRSSKGLLGWAYSIFQQGSGPTQVLMGLGGFLFVALPVIVAWIFLPHGDQLFGIAEHALAAVVAMGALGSVVSIMVRINDFARRGGNSAILFWTGFLKPVVGAAFALFLFAVVHSGWLPIAMPAESQEFMNLALGFVMGFSERFARDVIHRTEQRFPGLRDPEAASGNPVG